MTGTVDVSKNEHYNRGIWLYDRGLYTEAIAEFERVLSSAVANGAPERKLASFYMCEAYGNLGFTHLRMKMYRRAEEELKQALAIHPEYADLLCHLAVVYYRQGRYDEAEERLQKALAINPKFARALMYLGLTQLKMGSAGGLKNIAEAVKFQPAYSGEKYDQALSLYSGSTEEGIQLFEELAETDIDQVSYLLEKGLKLMKQQEYAAASETFLEAISVSPHYADLRHKLGLCYLHQGMTDPAVSEFNKALEINPRFVGARLGLAAAYRKADAPDLAVKELKHVLRLDPGNPEAERILAELGKGR